MARKRKLNRIGLVLKEKDHSQKWLAGQLGVHVNTVSQWVQNNQHPDLNRMYEISVLLDCDLKDLVASTKPRSKDAKT